MHNMELLTQKNFLLFASHYYQNIQCSSTDEFIEDLQRIKYIKKLITRYKETGELKERLILNHLIILHNVFSSEVLCKILFLKIEEYMTYLKPFLIYLNILPDKLYNIKNYGRVVDTSFVPLDAGIVTVLRKLKK